jgi:hypothetical protein
MDPIAASRVSDYLGFVAILRPEELAPGRSLGMMWGSDEKIFASKRVSRPGWHPKYVREMMKNPEQTRHYLSKETGT